MYIGVDTHKAQHVLAALDTQGRLVGTQRIANTPEGWAGALAWAGALDPACVWGIENSGSLGKGFAQAVLASGATAVYEISPQRTAQYRRHGRTPAKTDDTDALAIARLLMAEGDHLPAVQRDDLSTALRVVSDHRDNLLVERTRLINQLHAQMLQIDPAYKDKSSPLTQARGVAYCRDLRIPEAGDVLQMRLLIAQQLASQISSLDAAIAQLSAELERRVRASGTALLRLRGVGPVLAARMLGELGSTPRIPSAAALAALAGIAPVAVSSGGHGGYRLNRGGNRRLNRAIHIMALGQRRCEPRARAYYLKKRAEGKTGRAAMRCLKRRLVDVVYRAMCQDGGVSPAVEAA